MKTKVLGAMVALAVAGAVLPVAAQTAATPGGQLTISSDIQEANTRTGEVTASGNVRIEYPPRKLVATADRAVYVSRERKIVLSGNVRVFQADKNQLDADEVTYLIDKGLTQAKSKGRVKAVYTVPASEDEATTVQSNSKPASPQ